MASWMQSYLLTLAIEIPVIVAAGIWLGWFGPGRAISRPKAAALAWAVNLTHPLLWLAAPTTWAGLMAAEALIVAVEGAALAVAVARAGRASPLARPEDDAHPRPAPPPDGAAPAIAAFLVAFLANALSLGIGLLAAAALT